MQLRLALPADLDRLMEIRAAVPENRLDDPSTITAADYRWYMSRRLLWVAVDRDTVLGFSASDPRDGSIWALFVDPAHAGRGVGRALLSRACTDLAAAGCGTARLRTGSGTRAEHFYGVNGWRRVGTDARGHALMERPLDPAWALARTRSLARQQDQGVVGAVEVAPDGLEDEDAVGFG